MNDDSRNKLAMFEYLLDQDEEWFRRELDSAKRMIGQKPNQSAPAPQKPASVTYAPPRERERPAPQVQEPEEAPKGVKGLLILASLEALGILGLAAYWALVLFR